ncbi:MAG TPA: hemerythrin family protein [Thiolapillus brandeum]|uniref:Hemerythrin family protein n=1 Tax=Thiolapillus brandeum TaxID=1076588 RepID=A0A7C5N4T0_9GAMM|nr:hemerythrin family protein [Thiolapillus brandeum]
MARPNRYQRVSVFFAYCFYLAAVACVAAAAWFGWTRGGQSPAVAAFSASVVFFIGGGIVLHVMGRADLPNLKPDR